MEYSETMPDTKMLQILIDGQTSIKEELKKGFKEVKEQLKKVNDRLDSQGTSLAYLEDDAPTIKDFNNLKKRVRKIEIKVL